MSDIAHDLAVEVEDLVKRYPKREGNAVDGLSFTVRAGEIFGLLGPNGAGKSTTVGVLTTRIQATSGTVRVGGVDVRRDPVAARSRLAVVPQHNNLDRALTPRQNLTYHAAYHGVGRADRAARAERLLGQFGLLDQADAKVDWYSGGMAQRLMLARSLMHEPAVLFLDEPTNGLDPQTRLLVRGQIRELRDRGITVVLTTHQMNEADELVDTVGIVDHGRLIALDTPANLVKGLGDRSVLELAVTPGRGDGPGLQEALRGVAGVGRVERTGPALAAGAAASLRPEQRAAFLAASPEVRAKLRERAAAAGLLGPARLRLHLDAEPAAVLGPVLTVLYGRSATLNDVHITQPSLEDVFIGLTGREPR